MRCDKSQVVAPVLAKLLKRGEAEYSLRELAREVQAKLPSSELWRLQALSLRRAAGTKKPFLSLGKISLRGGKGRRR